jgi:hypothetical protein
VSGEKHYDTLFLKMTQSVVNLFQLLVLAFVLPTKKKHTHTHKMLSGFLVIAKYRESTLSSEKLPINLLTQNCLLVVAEP